MALITTAVAANRLGVACSFPRAELTTLSYKLQALGGAIADRLRLCTTNEERSEIVATEISAARHYCSQTNLTTQLQQG